MVGPVKHPRSIRRPVTHGEGAVSGATPGMPEVFAALEVLGTGLIHAGSPVGDGALSLDWRVEGVGGVSGSTGVSGDEDPVARRWLLPDGDHVHLSNFLLSKM